jgi:isopenicillin-N N-acyltransferase like protein
MASVSSVPVVTLSGSPYNVGFEQGRSLRRQVQRNVVAYFEFFQDFGGHTSEEVRSMVARDYMPVVWERAPDLAKEMQGIAAGADVEPIEIAAINARTELMFNDKTPGFSECTCLFVSPDRSQDGHAWLAQNWDFIPSLKDNAAVLVIDRGSRVVVTLTEAGLVGKIGFNSLGLGVCVDLLVSAADAPRVGLPMHVLLRQLLERADDLESAMAIVATTERTSAYNCMLADASGKAESVELTSATGELVSPERGILAHSNCFLSTRLGKEDRLGQLVADTGDRLRSVRRRLEAGPAGISVEDIRATLSDHVGYPQSICRHGGEFNMVTHASVIMDLSARRMLVAGGNPCEVDYHVVALDAIQWGDAPGVPDQEIKVTVELEGSTAG